MEAAHLYFSRIQSSGTKECVERRDASKRKREEISKAVKKAEEDLTNMSLVLRSEDKEKYSSASLASSAAGSNAIV